MLSLIITKAITYIPFFVVLLWGGKSQLGRDGFNEDYNSLKVMNSLKGLAAFVVILHHIAQEDAFFDAGVLAIFANAGTICVTIFFFCSGYGLLKSLDTKENYLKGFIRKRVVKSIVLPFYVNVLLYAVYNLIIGKKMPAAQWICNLTGLTMMNYQAWFPIVLVILYLSFYFVFRSVKNRKVAFGIMALIIVGLGMVFCVNGHFAWWYGEKGWWLDAAHPNTLWWREPSVLWFHGEWWVNTSIGFLAGLMFAQYEHRIIPWFKQKYALKFFGLLAITIGAYVLSEFGRERVDYWTEFQSADPGILRKTLAFFCQVPAFFLMGFLIMVFMMKYHIDNPVTRFFGKFSLDTYLMNLMSLEIMRTFMEKRMFPYYNKDYDLLTFAIGVVVLSIVLGVGEKYITDGLKKLLFPDKNASSTQKVTH